MTVTDERPMILGKEEPRLWTQPLRPLTPDTTHGFEAIRFAEEILEVRLLPWQRWWLLHALELTPDGRYRYRTILTLVGRQQGKALDTQTPILTTAGWSTMGDLGVGDEVYHPDGSPVRVVGAYDVMRDRTCYRVTTTDGRSIVADAEHLWTVQDRRNLVKKGRRGERPEITRPWETLTTAQLVERGLTRAVRQNASGGMSTDYAYRLPRQEALKSPDVPLPIDPYLLGAWLGDGSYQATALTIGDQDLDEMLRLIEAAGARIVSRKRNRTAWHVRISTDDRQRKTSALRCALVDLGVWGNKHAPDAYLTAGADQRLALLQGLMDTDGSIFATGTGGARAEFSSSRRELSEAVLYLARSLGWRATMRENAAYLNGREAGRRWRVAFTPQQGEPIPFRLARKAARVKPARDRGGERHAVSIASIEPVESRPVRCIKVDRPDGLYLAGRDLVPTHNTTLLKIVALWAMFMDRVHLVLGAAQSLDIARESWKGALDLARDNDELSEHLVRVLTGNTETSFSLSNGSRYRITAATPGSGRGLSVDLLILDEIREQRDWEAWGALSKTTIARPNALIVAISNAGDDKSIVLNSLRSAALAGEDESVALFEWSAPDGCPIDDPDAWAQAMPGLNRGTIDERTVRSALATDPENVFRTELLCQHVSALDAALDPHGWAACADRGLDFKPLIERSVMCLDVAPDGGHVSLVMAALRDDGKIAIVEAGGWTDTAKARAALAELLPRARPRALGWYPSGPAAVLAAELAELNADRRGPIGRMSVDRKSFREWAPGVVELKGFDVTHACQTLADLVVQRKIVHPSTDLLNNHATGAARLDQGDGWRFMRRGAGHVDAIYAAAGAAYLVRAIPAPAPPPKSAVW